MDRDRRKLLLAGGGLALLAGGGYLAFGGGLGGGPSGPVATAEAYVRALNDGDRQRANELRHPGAYPDWIREDTLATFTEADVSIASSELRERNGGEARVFMRLRVRQHGTTERWPSLSFLRREDGRWLVRDFNY